MRRKTCKRFIAVIGAAVLMAGLCSCSGQKKPDDGTRVSVTGEKKNYKNECESLKQKDYTNMSFKDCVFEDFPDIKDFQNLKPGEPTVTPEMALDAMRKSLDEYGLAEKYPVEESVVSLKEKTEDGDWMPVSRLMQETDPDTGEKKLKYADAFAVLSKEMCLMMVDDGYFKWINGTLNSYLSKQADAESSVFNAEDEYPESERYLYEDTGDTSFELLDGSSMSLSGAADMAAEFVADGVPYPVPAGVEIVPDSVTVHGNGDKNYYEVCVRRLYGGIPFSSHCTGSWDVMTDSSSKYRIDDDAYSIYIADASGVCGYMGSRASEKLDMSGDRQDSMISLPAAADIVSREMAGRLDMSFERAGLRYAHITDPYRPGSEDTDKDGEYRVCWWFFGTNDNYDNSEIIYVDAVSGKLYFELVDGM